MFNFFGKKKSADTVKKTFKINGMHCTSCSMNIDGELEDLPGVASASTSYAKSVTKVDYDPAQVSADQIKKVITELGYGAEQS